MKTTATTLWQSLLICGCLLIMIVSCKGKGEQQDETAEETAYAVTDSDNCNCEASWFPHSQTPPPAEGKGSPFDTTSTTNCIFHQWSWQKFLYLTKPESNGKPLFLNSMIQVDSKMDPITQQTGANLVLTDTAQAGSQGVLRSNPTYGTSRTVFYGIFIDPTLQASATQYKNELANGTLAPNNLATFPVGSLELKSAWIAIDAIPASDLGNYYTTTAAILQSNGMYQNTSVALLGMHVVGVVENHPEFIWATFQHRGMTALFDWNTLTASSPQETLFFGQGSTSSLDGITWNGSAPKAANQAFSLFLFGVPMDKGSTYMATSQSEPENYNNISNINNCVGSNLGDLWNNYIYNGSIWINMDGKTPQQQAQLLVSLGVSLDNAQPGADARGCVNAYNITMETYVQTFQSSISNIIDASNLVNCFTCHNAVGFSAGSPTSPLYLSHIFNGYIESSNNSKTLDQINRMKVEEYKELLIERQHTKK